MLYENSSAKLYLSTAICNIVFDLTVALREQLPNIRIIIRHSMITIESNANNNLNRFIYSTEARKTIESFRICLRHSSSGNRICSEMIY